jgi:cell division septal protein FtsQ
MKRNVLNSPHLSKLKKHRRRVVLEKILISLLGLLAVFFSAVYLSRLNSLNINDIEISGNKVVSTEMIKTIIEQQLAGKYLGLFPKTNLLFYPKNKIENALQNQLQRLKNIDLKIQNNKILQVSVTERIPTYLWCGADLPTNAAAENCYFMDTDGYIFDTAPYFSGEVYFKFYGGANINAVSPLGSYFSEQNFQQLISFKNILLSLNLTPVALDDTNDGNMTMLLSRGISLAADPKILFKADADFENVAENLQTALTTEPLQSEFKNKYASLEYIDLRFGNKVYYKFQ